MYHHSYPIVWITKYRYKVLTKPVKERLRELIAQVSEEMGVEIVNGVLSADHIHIFASIPPHIKVCDFVQKCKGRSSRKVQQEFQEIKKRYWGKHFWARGYFSSTSGNITDDIINEYIDNHTEAHRPNNINNMRLE